MASSRPIKNRGHCTKYVLCPIKNLHKQNLFNSPTLFSRYEYYTMTRKIFLLPLFLMFAFVVFAQEHEAHDTENDHDHDHGSEIGASVGPVYFINEGEFSFSTHIHYVYNFKHTKFGLGAGFERIFDEHKHRFVGAEINYRPIHNLTLNISPGIVFEGKEDVEKDFALHFETAYEFEFGVFHLGPVVEIAWHPENYHISMGVHIGFGL